MPQYLAPGVYVEEVSSGPPPIEGVGTNTAGFVGATRRGPVSGPAALVTSYAEFVRTFGGPLTGLDGWEDLAPAVRGFFDNGGHRAYVARAAGAVTDAGGRWRLDGVRVVGRLTVTAAATGHVTATVPYDVDYRRPNVLDLELTT